MKLLTLNTHSLQEEEFSQKLLLFADVLSELKPDIVALQEVSQSIPGTAELAPEHEGILANNHGHPVTSDNYLIDLMAALDERGASYQGAWLPIKLGYDVYEEGVGLLSRSPILDTDNFLISSIDDFSNWKTRRALGIKTEAGWFYSTHMGWWDDPDDPFKDQWARLDKHLKNRGFVALMGDFNNPAEVRGEGYDLVINSGWYDTYTLAESKDDGATVTKAIDGWRDSGSSAVEHMRIDFIFINQKAQVLNSHVICNGTNGTQVSDHAGIYTTLSI